MPNSILCDQQFNRSINKAIGDFFIKKDREIANELVVRALNAYEIPSKYNWDLSEFSNGFAYEDMLAYRNEHGANALVNLLK